MSTRSLSVLLLAVFPLLINGFSLQNPSSSSSNSPRLSHAALAAQSLTSSGGNNDDDIAENSRRALLISSAATVLGVAASSSGLISGPSSSSITAAAAAASNNNIQVVPSVNEAIQLIDASCDRSFLHAVVASDYRFLYRGIDESVGTPTVRKEAHDLLDLETYKSEEALQFFTKLETSVLQNDPVKPSNGHLGITSATSAATWGTTAASIWPLGEDAHFAWFEKGGEFWPRPMAMADRKEMIIDGRDCGKESLEDALRGDNWEVLFSGQSFLAVPVRFEQELREGLKNSFIM